MVRRFYPTESTLTKAEYDALELDRPYTDAPIGGTTDGKRSAGALCSSLFDHPSIIPTPRQETPVTIRHDPEAADHTLTRREVMAARDADVPRWLRSRWPKEIGRDTVDLGALPDPVESDDLPARDADAPGNVAVCPVGPRKPESGTDTTPETENDL